MTNVTFLAFNRFYFCEKRNTMRILTVIIILTLSLTSCGDSKKDKKFSSFPDRPATAKEKSSSNTVIITKGKKLFSSKTCTTCHLVDKKVIGPSIKEITKVYKTNQASLVTFLEGKSKAIVDTTPGQVAIMQANINGFLKGMSIEELKAIEAYMLSVK